MTEAEKAIDRFLTTEDDAAAILRYYYFDRPLHRANLSSNNKDERRLS